MSTLDKSAPPVLARRPPLPPLGPLARGPRIPLSHSQAVWFPDRPNLAELLRVTICLRLDGPLDPCALEEALRRLIVRHEILRTVYRVEDGEAWQSVLPEVATRLDVISVADFPYCERDARAGRILSELWQGDEVDFVSGRNLRARIARVGPEEALLALWINHVAADGPSSRIVLEDLNRLYASVLSGTPDDLPPLPFQYADYALWEHASSGPRLNEVDYLSDYPPLQLGAKGGRSDEALSAQGAVFLINQDPWARAHRFAKSEGATPVLVLLAALGVIFSAWSKQTRYAFGQVVSARPPAAERLIGCFTRVKPFAVEISPDFTMRQALAATRSSYLRAIDRRLDFAPEVTRQRDLFRVGVNIQKQALEGEIGRGPLYMRQSAVALQPARKTTSDLLLNLFDKGPFVLGDITYPPDRLDSGAVDYWLGGCVTELLEKGLAEPERPLRTLFDWW